ncbi:hypothetical protein FIE12Z_7638 [Fusarium flagelliforme]|uniref:Uncharacterized protein n=1 Tax=Fusarium flagelliforme TaxID=2675880 RepID=A0A395MK09_9HYPO|nr:hypothetical protein FIE12Z_7638 [Fusarium flagelliforme]
MDSLHAEIFGDVNDEVEIDLYDQEPESSCTKPPKRSLGRDEDSQEKSSLELVLKPKTSHTQDDAEIIPPGPTENTNETTLTANTKSRITTENNTKTFARRLARTYSEEGAYASHATSDYRSESNASSDRLRLSSTKPRRRRRPQSSHTQPASSNRYDQYAVPIPDVPTYHRSSANLEVIKIGSDWHLLSTKCHIEKHVDGHSIHYHEHRHWTEALREPSHCSTCKRIQLKHNRIPEEVLFSDVDVTFINKAPRRGFSEEVWSAMIGKPLPIRGTRHAPARVVRSRQVSGTHITVLDIGTNPAKDNSHEID